MNERTKKYLIILLYQCAISLGVFLLLFLLKRFTPEMVEKISVIWTKSINLEKMEGLGTEAFGLVHNPHRRTPHLQSWFIGMTGLVYSSQWFSDFMYSVTAEDTKEDVCMKYENGFTELLSNHSVNTAALFYVGGKKIYNSVYKLYRKGLPFIKKAAFVRHNGCLGGKVNRILNRVDPRCRQAIVSDASRVYGENYMKVYLTENPFVLAGRYISYLFSKIS